MSTITIDEEQKYLTQEEVFDFNLMYLDDNYGLSFDSPFDVVKHFEKMLAERFDFNKAVVVDSCTNAIFLSAYYLKNFIDTKVSKAWIPRNTYVSVPQTLKHVGLDVDYSIDLSKWDKEGEDKNDTKWEQAYHILISKEQPGCVQYAITDSAVCFNKYKPYLSKYIRNISTVMSFHKKKPLNLIKGGVILTDDLDFAHWASLARYEGRHLDIPYKRDRITINGWNMYMTPETAIVGICRMLENPGDFETTLSSKDYPPLTEIYNG